MRLPVILTVVAIGLAAARVLAVTSSAVPVSVLPSWDMSILIVGFIACGWLLTLRTRFQRLALAVHAFSLLTVALVAAAAASVLPFYVGRSFPLIDGVLNRIDLSLGFDWLAFVQWIDRFPIANWVLLEAYKSLLWQPALTVGLLAAFSCHRQLYTFALASQLSLIVTLIAATLLPAVGPYAFLDAATVLRLDMPLVTADLHVPRLLWLREAQFESGVRMPQYAGGLVSFPSFHAAAGFLYMWAARHVPVARWIVVVLNVLMLIATINHGSHYLVDIIAGAAVAAMAIWLAERFVARALRRPPAYRAA